MARLEVYGIGFRKQGVGYRLQRLRLKVCWGSVERLDLHCRNQGFSSRVDHHVLELEAAEVPRFRGVVPNHDALRLLWGLG